MENPRIIAAEEVGRARRADSASSNLVAAHNIVSRMAYESFPLAHCCTRTEEEGRYLLLRAAWHLCSQLADAYRVISAQQA